MCSSYRAERRLNVGLQTLPSGLSAFPVARQSIFHRSINQKMPELWSDFSDSGLPQAGSFEEACSTLRAAGQGGMTKFELGPSFTMNARIGFHALMNYCGGAFVYVRREYAGRIKTIISSWNLVQKSEVLAAADEDGLACGCAGRITHDALEMKVPTTFNEMLLFNASVMGYGSSTWMNIVLQQFDDMVRNVANFGRLQEECDVMSLVLGSFLAMMLYWALLSDLAIFSMRISAFVLVCGRVVIEVGLFLTALLLLILAFCTMASLDINVHGCGMQVLEPSNAHIVTEDSAALDICTFVSQSFN
eukprot:Skav203703  [mRNA]  locus=scaffold259:362240:390330:+ [translate_table: standard]